MASTIDPIVAALTTFEPRGIEAIYGDRPDVIAAIHTARANGRGSQWIAERLSTDTVKVTRGQVETFLKQNGPK